MLAKISKDEAKWLLEEYAPKRGYRIDSSTFGMYLKAYNLMKGANRRAKCFSCEGRAIAAMANSLYEQYENDIQAVLKPKRGRKSGSQKK